MLSSPEGRWVIPEPHKKLALTVIAADFVQQAQKILARNIPSISFHRGSPETYVIVAGIVQDNSKYEARFTFKSLEKNLKSNCHCNLWSTEHHCPHVAALLLYYLIHQDINNEAKITSTNEDGYELGAHPSEYGTVVNSLSKLTTRQGVTTYSFLNYRLISGNVIPFPTPQPLNGRIIVNCSLSLNEQLIRESTDSNSLTFHFYHRDETGELNKQVSILEHLYLFDWNKGDVFHLPNQLKSLFSQLKRIGSIDSLEELQGLINYNQANEFVELTFNGLTLDQWNNQELFFRVDLASNSATIPRAYSLRIHFNGLVGQELPAPLSIQHLAELISLEISEARKRFAAENLEHLIKFLQSSTSGVQEQLNFLSDKSKLLMASLQSETILSLDHFSHRIYKFQSQKILSFFYFLMTNFREQLLKINFANHYRNSLIIPFSENVLIDNLVKIQGNMHSLGIDYALKGIEIKSWDNQITFERNKQKLDWFELTFSISQEDLEIIQLADLDKSHLTLNDQIILIPDDKKQVLKLLKKYIGMEGKLDQTTGKFVVPFNRARIFELLELKKAGMGDLLTEEENHICESLENLDKLPNYPIPEKFVGVLRPYQKQGYQWLKFLYHHKFGACLADDMGLGKTIQAISLLESLKDEISQVLIACPVSILLNWHSEFKKFSSLNPIIYHGGAREIPEDAKVILTSYGVLRREYTTTFSDRNFDVFIMDEVQHLKNFRSIGSFAARSIKSNFRLCLTGTPVENNIIEFFNILDLSIPGVWGSNKFFKTRDMQKNRLVARKTASPYILRRTKDQVLDDLPPKMESYVYLEFSEEERSTYINQLVQIREKLANEPSSKRYGEILKNLLRMRQACLWQGDTQGLKKGFIPSPNKLLSTKIRFLMDQLEQILEENHQCIIFSQFTTYLDMIQHYIRENNWKFSRIDGTMTATSRQKQVELFQGGENKIFLISLKAGGVGLNLTAASYVFIMDPWWNPAVENQAIDRAHRIGQKNTLTVYRPIIKNSIEEKVLELQKSKKELFAELLSNDSDEIFAGQLTMQDFEQLLT
jgi:SNF2 family DNA or RNA helicase